MLESIKANMNFNMGKSIKEEPLFSSTNLSWPLFFRKSEDDVRYPAMATLEKEDLKKKDLKERLRN